MSSEESLFLVAVFGTPEAAQLARDAMYDRGVHEELIRISADVAVHVRVDSAHLSCVADALRSLGALSVTTTTRAPDPGWMSHITGTVVGAQVMPGAGDSEAGNP